MFIIGLLQVKWLKKLHDALFANGGIPFFNEDSGNVTFSRDEIDIFIVNLDKINLYGVNFDEDYLEINVRLIAWQNIFKQSKSYKNGISKELIPVAWHPTRWLDWCMPEDEERKTEPIFNDKS